jgi:hypothetical protein
MHLRTLQAWLLGLDLVQRRDQLGNCRIEVDGEPAYQLNQFQAHLASFRRLFRGFKRLHGATVRVTRVRELVQITEVVSNRAPCYRDRLIDFDREEIGRVCRAELFQLRDDLFRVNP